MVVRFAMSTFIIIRENLNILHNVVDGANARIFNDAKWHEAKVLNHGLIGYIKNKHKSWVAATSGGHKVVKQKFQRAWWFIRS